MNEQRLQAYLNLIQTLLNCPSGEESEFLAANQELIDAGLVQTMAQVAEMLAERGDENGADWLRNVLRQQTTSVGQSSQLPLAEYGNFLLQVLQATADSRGEPRVLYQLLQQNLDKLDDTFAQVLQSWAAENLPDVESEEAQSIAADIGNFSNLIQQFPLGSRASNLEIAIIGYEIVATVFSREANPQAWATMQYNLGIAYSDRIRGERAENLELAISCYTQALEVRNRRGTSLPLGLNTQYLAHSSSARFETC